MTDPIANGEQYTYVVMGGRRTPGIATLSGNSGSPRKWDERAGYGLTGSTLVFTGKGLAKFDVLIELYDAQDFADWAVFLPYILAEKSLRELVLDTSHPWLAQFKIAKAVVLDIGIPKETDEGVTQVTIPCQAHRKPKFALAKPDSAKATPTDPNEVLIGKLSDDLRAANQQLADGK